jgi:hypothetical protein
VEGSELTTSPELEPLELAIDGTLEGVYTIEDSAYMMPDSSADNRVFTLTVPVQALNITQGTQIAIARLRDTDNVQFNLISPAIIPNATSGTFVFAISAASATNYPGTNTDAWRVTFTAQDGRTISRDVITKFNYLVAARPLAVTVASTTVTAKAQDEATPSPTFVTLKAVVSGGNAPYTYLWNVSAISSDAPFTVVGPLNRPTLTLQLRGTTFNNQQFDDVVWPSPLPGETTHQYAVPVTLVVRDATLPAQEATASATAGIRFIVDDTNIAVTPTYVNVVADHSYNAAEPYTLKGRWICNSQYTGSVAAKYDTYQRVSLGVINGSGSYTYTWTEVSRATGSSLSPVIVYPSNSSTNQSVYFKTVETNCVAGTRFYEGVWRCDIVDQHTGATLSHQDVVRIDVCRAVPGSIDNAIQKVPVGVGFVCG